MIFNLEARRDAKVRGDRSGTLLGLWTGSGAAVSRANAGRVPDR
jgi:hypothetical protein